MLIRSAETAERQALEQLQLRASTALPDYRDAILEHPESIYLDPKLLCEGRVRIAEVQGQAIGFSVLLRPAGGTLELEGLFVDPPCWRRGAGTALLLDAVRQARLENASAIEVTANPAAVNFYAKFGFVRSGEAQTRFGQAPRMRYLICAASAPPQRSTLTRESR